MIIYEAIAVATQGALALVADDKLSALLDSRRCEIATDAGCDPLKLTALELKVDLFVFLLRDGGRYC